MEKIFTYCPLAPQSFVIEVFRFIEACGEEKLVIQRAHQSVNTRIGLCLVKVKDGHASCWLQHFDSLVKCRGKIMNYTHGPATYNRLKSSIDPAKSGGVSLY